VSTRETPNLPGQCSGGTLSHDPVALERPVPLVGRARSGCHTTVPPAVGEMFHVKQGVTGSSR
ncbi:MAG: hypothetical protein KGI14_09475, partial [Acidobacteriota bacterium]|nr:hypothetical protein [Acidobacteriota bacterium]